jgi:esterase
MKLFYQEYGSGPPLIIIHGLLGMSDHWSLLGKQFSKYFHVVIPDLRNHGRSPHDARSGYCEMEEDLLLLASDLKLEQFSMIGHSMGGRLAMLMLMKYPELINRCIVVDIGLSELPPDRSMDLLIDIISKTLPEEFKTLADASDFFESYGLPKQLHVFLLKNLRRAQNGRLMWKLNIAAIENSLPEIKRALPVEKSVDNEILIIRGGSSDQIRSPEDEALIRSVFPKVIWHTIENTGHWVHAENPVEFFDVSLRFLKNPIKSSAY